MTAVVIGLLLAPSSGRQYDTSHPDYASLEEQFEVAHQALLQGQAGVHINFADLADGAWKEVCLFGGYTRPSEHFQAAALSEEDRARWKANRDGWISPFEVEEWEVVVAYLDMDERAHFIHFPGGIGSGGQHYSKCITRPETRLQIVD